MREIEEAKHRRSDSQYSYTFHEEIYMHILVQN